MTKPEFISLAWMTSLSWGLEGKRVERTIEAWSFLFV